MSYYQLKSKPKSSRTKRSKHTQEEWSRQQKIIKQRAEINEIETKRTIRRINETKSWFIEKTVDKPLSNLTKRHRKNIQISKIRSVNGDITTDKKIHRIRRTYFKIYTLPN